MRNSDWEKFRRLFDDLYQTPPKGSPEETLEREVREAFYGMKGRDGKLIDRDVTRGKVNPLRTIASKLDKAKRKGVPREQVVKLERVLHAYIEQKWPEQSDDFTQHRRRA